MRRSVCQSRRLKMVPHRQPAYPNSSAYPKTPQMGAKDARKDLVFFIDLGVPNTSQSASESFGKVVREIVVLQACVPETSGKDDEVGEEVGGPEGG